MYHVDLYAKLIENNLTQFYNKHKSQYDDYTTYCMMNGYFITLTFDRTRIEREYAYSSGSHRGAFEFENFHRLYNSVCRSLVGRHYDRPAQFDRLPLAITVLDVEGTKYANSMPALKNLHLHSIWMSTPEFTDKLSRILMNPNLSDEIPRNSDFDNIDVRTLALDRNGSISSDLTAYVAKSIRLNQHNIILNEDMRVYPIDKIQMNTIQRFRPS